MKAPDNITALRARADGAAARLPPDATIDPRPAEFSDDALAQQFTEHYGADWRYVHAWGRWLQYSGAGWNDDRTLEAFDNARTVCRQVAAHVMELTHLKADRRARIADAIRSSKTVAAVVALARADRLHAATVSQWDADPWLLNTPGGEVDLRSGKMRAHRRESYCTKRTSVAPSTGPVVRWLKFLHRVTGDDQKLVDYLQRLCGYALAGVVTEHALCFLYGLGANGKSTFVNVLSGILSDYAQTAPTETFTETSGAQHPTDQAMLRGARLVTATETEDGRKWAAAKIKVLTGGDRIAARFMRQDFFEFVPQFTLVISGNHKPGLRSVDEAMRRRLHLVPFTQTIPAAERDKGLQEALRAEWPQILAWMIDGCLLWQRDGLAPPEVVREATEDYLDAEDTLGLWLDEATTCEPPAFECTAALHRSYQRWAERAGERFMGTKRFSQALEERGLLRHRTGSAKGFRGRRLKPMENDFFDGSQ